MPQVSSNVSSSFLAISGKMLDDILTWASNVVFIMSVVLFILFYWIVVKKSPMEIKVYKWYIIWNASLLLIVEIMFGISHPQILYPHLTFVLTGIFSKYSFSEDLHRVCIELGASILVIYMYSTLIMFPYRYAQTVETDTLRRILESPKIYIFHILVLILICLANIGPMQSVFLHDSELKPLYETEFPEIYDKYQDRIFIGIKEIPYFIYYSMTFFIVLTVIITLYCTFMTYRNLRRIKYKLSSITFQMYRRLINALLLEFCLFSFFGGVPALFFMISAKFNTSYSIIIGQFVMFLVGFLPPSVIILNLVYIEAYKRALKNLVNQILIFAKLKKKPNVVVSTVVAFKVEMMPRWKARRSTMP